MTGSPNFGSTECPQHVMVQGTARGSYFLADEDYRHYLKLLVEVCAERGCAVHAYVLMENHVRMLLTPRPDFGTSWVMADLSRRYKEYIRGKARRSEVSCGSCYRAGLIGSGSQLFACCRYIELNPVRAGLAEHASKYGWSSFLHNAMGCLDPVVRPHEFYLRLGKTDSERQQKYRDLFRRPLNSDRLNQIRLALKPAPFG